MIETTSKRIIPPKPNYQSHIRTFGNIFQEMLTINLVARPKICERQAWAQHCHSQFNDFHVSTKDLGIYILEAGLTTVTLVAFT
jgi:phosphatidate phosphatase APP1